MLTTFDADEYVFSALRAGVSGFLLKDAAPEELVYAVRVVAAGDALLSPQITRTLISDYASRPAAPRTDSTVGKLLTERELDVDRLVSRWHSNTELAEMLFLADPPVYNHVTHI